MDAEANNNNGDQIDVGILNADESNEQQQPFSYHDGQQQSFGYGQQQPIGYGQQQPVGYGESMAKERKRDG